MKEKKENDYGHSTEDIIQKENKICRVINSTLLSIGTSHFETMNSFDKKYDKIIYDKTR